MGHENTVSIMLAPLPSTDVNKVRNAIENHLRTNWFIDESFLKLQCDGLLKFIVHPNQDSADMRNIEIILTDGGWDNPSRPRVLAEQVFRAIGRFEIANVKADISPRAKPINGIKWY